MASSKNATAAATNSGSSSSTSSSALLSNQPLYEEISVIGTGAYGTVYKGYDLKTSRIVAMKRIRIQLTDEGLPISTIREIAYLRHLEKFDHENVVKLYDVCHGPRLQSEQSIILIFEYVDYDLDAYLKLLGGHGVAGHHSGHLTLAKITDIMRQMIVGVDFLHMNRIIHRDLKPQNILVTKEGKIKIADFGLARIYGFSMTLTSVVVTLWYRSPEVLLHSTYSTSVDIWSLGCILAELYMRRPLFIGQSDVDQLFKIFDILGLPGEQDWPANSVIPLKSFSNANNTIVYKDQTDKSSTLRKLMPNIDDDGLDLLLHLLDFNLDRRFKASEALEHAYFKKLNNEASSSSSSSSSSLAKASLIINQAQSALSMSNGSSSVASALANTFLMANLNENSNDSLSSCGSKSAATAACDQENTNNVALSGGGGDSGSNRMASLPDITNLFQPNILKRKRQSNNIQQ